ncbi:MAG: transglutaminase-like domain-containing protein, partial [Acidobacteriota bacterium]|nr:transglutaminase-like domain-containing protein [Acidobacteriota bacterium]
VVVSNYPVTPAIRAMARQIAGSETAPLRQAAAIEQFLSTRFRYVSDPSKIGHAMTVDQFLLRDHRGHCEYFAAGMVALMTALDVPARIVGGFYGGTLNPLTGYFVVRREDAHAWVEVWDGQAWQTFDPTPASLRPGNEHDGLLRVYASALSDWVNYFWDRHILTFGLGDQIALIIDLIDRGRGAASAVKTAIQRSVPRTLTRTGAIATAGLLAAALAVIALSRRRQPVFALLAAHLRRLGVEVGPAVTIEEALDELRHTQPLAAVVLDPLIDLYEAERFSAKADRGRVRAIRKRLAELAT